MSFSAKSDGVGLQSLDKPFIELLKNGGGLPDVCECVHIVCLFVSMLVLFSIDTVVCF